MVLLSEQKITLAKAARKLSVNPSTTWRWALNGVRGVKLETFSVGVKRFTTEEAVERFIASTTEAANASHPQVRTNRQRQADIDRAESELAKDGI